jgi:hypothetical protein
MVEQIREGRVKEIELTNGGVALVDDEDYEFLSEFRWNRHDDLHTSYAVKCFWYKDEKKRRTLGMHRFLAVCDSQYEIDHIDGDGLNNQKSNIRVVLPCVNQWNSRKRVDNSVGLKGVTFVRGRYMAQIQEKKKHRHIGCYGTAEEAHAAYLAEDAKRWQHDRH